MELKAVDYLRKKLDLRCFKLCDANFTLKKISSYKFIVVGQLIPRLKPYYVYATVVDYIVHAGCISVI